METNTFFNTTDIESRLYNDVISLDSQYFSESANIEENNMHQSSPEDDISSDTNFVCAWQSQ